MADNNNTNGYQANRVSTSGLTLFDDNGVMLKLGYLDDSLSLVIGMPKVAESGKRSYPQEARHPFIITMDRAAALYNEIITKKVVEALEKGEDYNGGIFINKRKDAIFEVRVQQGDIYLAYHKDIGEDRTPKESHIFKCSKTPIVESYQVDGSSFEMGAVDGTFMLICKYFEAGIDGVHCADTHGFRVKNYYTTNSIFNYLKSFAAKLGVTVDRASYGQTSAPTSGFMSDAELNAPDESGVPFEATATDLGSLLS